MTRSVETVRGVGEAVARLLQRLNVKTVEDLILNVPRKYDDYSLVTPIAKISPGPLTVQATLSKISGRYVRRGLHITEASISDASGAMRVAWFNQPYRAGGMKTGEDYYFSGKYELGSQRLQLMNPSAELVKDFPVNTARIVPIYRETKGLTSHQIRKIVANCLPTIRTLDESLPQWLVDEQKLMPRAEAYQAMHFPNASQQLSAARWRLGFEEVFGLSLAGLMNKREMGDERTVAIPFDLDIAKSFVAKLPFSLTGDQRRVVWQIYQDMASTTPTNRLVEGDVGAGKTVVAAMAAVMALHQGYQVALMAPTELLAKQHAESISALLQPLGLAERVCLLVGSLKPKQKKQAHAAIESGRAGFIIGTHALIQDAVAMPRLGLVIIDEQHRFGVEQRKALLAKSGYVPHVVSLTATPIPRSLALTLYGELDISVLRDKPANRLPIRTKLVSPNSLSAMYSDVAKELAAGRQVFVVCPLITDDSTGRKASVDATYKVITKQFADYRVGLLHGKQKPAEKDEVMRAFAAHKLDILVATTVVEVGVDVPNATVMVVHAADTFGLAQLHQLRGRVGRGEHQSYCYLILSDSRAPSRRLRAIETSNDGFRLAELDLDIRGPGAIYGQLQHGALDLRVAKLSDTDLITAARRSAEAFMKRGENLLEYPELKVSVERLRAVTNLN